MPAQRSLVADSFWNLAGLAAPLAVAVWAIPALLLAAGPERFGVLSLIWVLIGYSNLFDFGLGRALTRRISAAPADSSVLRVVPPALAVLAGVGLAGAGVLWAVSGLIASRLHTAAPMGEEAVEAFRWTSAAVPALTLTAGLRGVLEAQRRFAALSLARMAMGVLTFAAPLAAASAGAGLPGMAASLVATRYAVLGAHGYLAAQSAPRLLSLSDAPWRAVAPLIRFGGWLTLSGLISPLLVSIDRFWIGAVLSPGAVTLYVVPFEIASRLLVLPAAAVGPLFPRLSEPSGRLSMPHRRLYQRAAAAMGAVLFLPCAVLAAWPDLVLGAWLKTAPHPESARVLTILACGVWINGCANIAATWLHAQGRSRTTALLHVAELPLFAAALYILVPWFGITGAAAAWTGRVGIDAILLFWLNRPDRCATKPAWRFAGGDGATRAA